MAVSIKHTVLYYTVSPEVLAYCDNQVYQNTFIVLTRMRLGCFTTVIENT